MDNKKSLFIKCQCSTHCFEIERFYSADPNDDIKFNLTFWCYGRSGEILDWKQRFRWICNIFRTGKPWADGIIISNDQSKEIVEYINKYLQKE